VTIFKSFLATFTNDPNMEIDAAGITLLVGPNNSGKSLFLREIQSLINSNKKPNNHKIVTDFNINDLGEYWLTEFFRKQEEWHGKARTEANRVIGYRDNHSSISRNEVNYPNIQNYYENAFTSEGHRYNFASQVLRAVTTRLDGRTRFNISDDQPAGDLQSPPTNPFTELFVNDDVRKKLQSTVFSAIGQHLVVDPTQLGQLRLRLSRNPPPKDEQSLSATARSFYADSIHIKDASDGIQAFIGVTLSLVVGGQELLLIDEPEAFLHPPLAEKLGRMMGRHARETGAGILAATHSSSFLYGCVLENPQTTIIRLNYTNGISTAHRVPSQRLREVFLDPLMRSSNALSGIFFDGVIVVEAERDRAFYEECYFRLSAGKSDFPNIKFICAQNKQTIPRIIGPLREFGVPAIGIADLDMIKEGGESFSGWLKSTGAPQAIHESLQLLRDRVKMHFQSVDMKKDGIEGLGKEGQEAAKYLLDSLAKYGIFLVPVGEVECWLKYLGIKSRKDRWLESIFLAMGNDPDSDSYVSANGEDVWRFLDTAVSWIKDGNRYGMPASSHINEEAQA
jgi:predicted ATPase